MKHTPENVKKFCTQHGITEDQFYGREKIVGNLNLSDVEKLIHGFCPDISGDLDLSSLTSMPENITLTVGGSLDLSSLTSMPENITLTVGGSLYLSSLTSMPENITLTVGGSLYMNNQKRHIGDSVTIPEIHLDIPEVYTWQNGQYIKADGIFMEVVSKRGNIYRVRKVNKHEVTYLITDGHGKWSHGETLDEARADLIYKISNRNKDHYRHLTLDSEVTFAEGIEAYRVITGACSFGTRDFCENRLAKKADKYTIREIIILTKGEYKHQSFESFFQK